jgi:CRP-like cAMP-binding protein
MCSEGACVEALTALKFRRDSVSTDEMGIDAVNEWTLQLLRVRHLGQAEQRLHALLALLVNRLGLRCSDSYQLPFRLTHDRFGELIGATRVTTTRLLSKWRQADLVAMAPGDVTMRLSPDLISSSPLQF